MTDRIPWFIYQLQASADTFVWAFSQIDLSLRLAFPPAPEFLGTWEPARHFWHVTEYERCLALPSMLQWLDCPPPPENAWPDDDDIWVKVRDRSFECFISAFRAIRREQILALERLAFTDWNLSKKTIWGIRPLSMVVTKTLQHTYEHGDTLLKMGLWWRSILEMEAKKAA